MSNNATSIPSIPQGVSKQLASSCNTAASSSKRVPPEAAEAISEALRLFVREAHRRASIEAECDDEGEFRSMNESDNNDNNDNNDNDNNNDSNAVVIHAHHVTRIAGDLLMDFS